MSLNCDRLVVLIRSRWALFLFDLDSIKSDERLTADPLKFDALPACSQIQV